VILVTGASQGIGYECAKVLLTRTTSEVVITGRSSARLTAARDALPPAVRQRLQTRVCDQCHRRDVEALAAYVASSASSLEIAILAVGVNPAFAEGPRRLHGVSATTIEDAVRTNCTHQLILTTAVLRAFWARRAGTLVWIGSRAAAVGLRGSAVYCATKSFLSGLARAAHNEYGPSGIRVHLLNPGLVRTPRTAGTVDQFAAAHGQPVHAADGVANAIVQRLLCPGDGAVEADV